MFPFPYSSFQNGNRVLGENNHIYLCLAGRSGLNSLSYGQPVQRERDEGSMGCGDSARAKERSKRTCGKLANVEERREGRREGRRE